MNHTDEIPSVDPLKGAQIGTQRRTAPLPPPPSDLLTGDEIAAFDISGDRETRHANDGPGRARV